MTITRSSSLKQEKRKTASRRSNSLNVARAKSASQVLDENFNFDVYESEMSPEPCDDFPVVEIKKKKTPQIQDTPKELRESKVKSKSFHRTFI